jgi:uncharacterized membrane protein
MSTMPKKPAHPVLLDAVMATSWLALLLLLSAPLLLVDGSSLGAWLMACLPLLLTLPGLLRRNRRSLQWLGFLVLFYFMLGVLQAFSPQPLLRWIGLLLILFCALLFGAAIVSLRHGRNQLPGE